MKIPLKRLQTINQEKKKTQKRPGMTLLDTVQKDVDNLAVHELKNIVQYWENSVFEENLCIYI